MSLCFAALRPLAVEACIVSVVRTTSYQPVFSFKPQTQRAVHGALTQPTTLTFTEDMKFINILLLHEGCLYVLLYASCTSLNFFHSFMYELKVQF